MTIHAKLNQNQFDALCSFVYNLGPQALWNWAPGKVWHNTPTQVNRKINANPNDPTIRDAMLLFDRQNPSVNKRHAGEADQYFS